MKHNRFFVSAGLKLVVFLLLLPAFFNWMPAFSALNQIESDSEKYLICKGLVTDAVKKEPLSFASVSVEGTNIATVTNAEGGFLMKIPVGMKNGNLLVSFLGYKNRTFRISDFSDELNRLEMEISPISLPDVNVVFKDAESLMREVLERKGENYLDQATEMTAFYRETIRKRKSYIALLESVIDIYKYSYVSARNDMAAIYKIRKQTDYNKLDTVVFKLMGGPYNTLYTDIMKDHERVFTDKIFENYIFSYDKSTMIDNKMVYVLDFKQRPSYSDPLFYGKLYIDAQNFTLVSAVYDMNLENVDVASELFIRKKPAYAKVKVTKARYRVNYISSGDKWYLGYNRVELDVEINWKRKLFNTTYESVMEMAVTDWKPAADDRWSKAGNRLRPHIVVSDAVSGFSDVDFWGPYNVIEPEKPIGSAIKKIQKQLEQKK